MKINLNEVSKLKEFMGMDNIGEFICNLEEDNDDYECIVEEICSDFKHNICEALREAIYCGFDKEILSIDCGISTNLIDILLDYKDKEIEVDL